MGCWTTTSPMIDGYYPAVMEGDDTPCVIEVCIVRDDEAEIVSRALMILGRNVDHSCDETFVEFWYSEPLPVIPRLC